MVSSVADLVKRISISDILLFKTETSKKDDTIRISIRNENYRVPFPFLQEAQALPSVLTSPVVFLYHTSPTPYDSYYLTILTSIPRVMSRHFYIAVTMKLNKALPQKNGASSFRNPIMLRFIFVSRRRCTCGRLVMIDDTVSD